MARYLDDPRYDDGGAEVPFDQGGIDRPVIIPDDTSTVDQVPVEQVVADQNDYPLPPGQIILFSTDASRNFTGFSGSRPGVVLFCNDGSFDGVIVHNSGSSTAENRVLNQGSVNITVAPNGFAIMFYDFKNSRWRAR